MYAKFAAAIICIMLSTFNVVAAVRRTPVRTVLEESSRTTVVQMQSPGAGVHWSSAVIFAAFFACFLGWGLSDYNNSLDSGEHESSKEQPDANKPSPTNLPKNVVQFSPRVISPVKPNQPGVLSPEEFFAQLEDSEDYWADDNQPKDNHSH
ncbi:hypothetical protein DSM106972_052680 [Dulcicalothrix desertica PCC 7102]|uniref:Uncharacterized protein n=1 Tax=Dulcicalothrix desertica PCC 7102 TaxID=232991 RepID=A0A433VC87_9CYAN|nr:hypothetical protein [Dulcicalothrix desertica]RUT03629.1 hypothetical protein DSM106972_052680 [Dulcicalothrix desertica PCC 7102]TWH43931.1 hypothetical protein CAL7102_07683 [Dulcicalothrix desertica PCC 7102]